MNKVIELLKDKKVNDTITMDKYVGTILCSLTCMKRFHWKASRYSEHIACDEYVKAMGKKLDRFVESFQGCGHVLDFVDSIDHPNYPDPISFLMFMKNFICSKKTIVIEKEYTELLNIVDEMLSVCDVALYKLKHLL